MMTHPLRSVTFGSLLALSALCVSAQPSSNTKLPADLVNFFQGNWSGSGEFASGKPISATLLFSLALDSAWLSGNHSDVAPGSYKALLMWGIDKATGKFAAYNFDNFQGHRQFDSDGFHAGKIVLTNTVQLADSKKYYERFIYEKLSDNSFKMKYEVSRDNINWKLGDYLVFNKKN